MKKLVSIIILLLMTTVYAQNWDWIQTVGLGGNNYTWDIEHDNNNNIILVGRVKGTVKFGLDPQGQTAAPIGAETDVFVVKFSAVGDLLWWKREGDVNPDWARSVDVDDQNNIYVAGDFCNIAVFENDTIYGYDNGQSSASAMARSGFIAKYDEDGNLLWVHSYEGEGNCKGNAVSVDGNGNAFVTGFVTGLGTFGSQNTGSSGTTSAFIAKYNSSGNLDWVSSQGASLGCVGNDILITDDQKLYLTGYWKGSMTVGADNYTSTSTSWGDFFLTAMDDNGNHLWTEVGGSPFFDEGIELTTDSDGNIYTLGHFTYQFDIGSTQLNGMGNGPSTSDYNANWDSFLAKYTSNGDLLWVNQIGNSSKTQFDGIDHIGDEQILITGYAIDTIFIGGDSLIPNTGNHNTFVIAFDTAGVYQWNHQVESNAAQVSTSVGYVSGNAPRGIAVDKDYNIYVGGYYNDEGIWDTIQNTADAGWDAWVSKMYPPLNAQLIGQNMVCQNDTINFIGDAWGSPLNYSWNVLNSTVINELDSSYSVQFDTPQPNDSITFFVSNGYDSLEIKMEVLIGQIPVNLGADIETCDSVITLNAGSYGLYYDWGSGPILNDSLLTVSTDGTYMVFVEDNGCTGSDTIDVTFLDCAGLESFITEIGVIIDNEQSLAMIMTNSLDYSVYIHNVSGQVLKVFGRLSEQKALDISSLSSGIYILTFTDNLNGYFKSVKFYKR